MKVVGLGNGTALKIMTRDRLYSTLLLHRAHQSEMKSMFSNCQRTLIIKITGADAVIDGFAVEFC